MKSISAFFNRTKYMFSVFFVFAVSLNVNAQKQSNSNLKDFKITIENTKDGVKMKSHEGSRWLDLSFSTIRYITQAINEDGMTNLKADSERSESADYLFTIKKSNNEIKLVGLRGTAWEELSFTLPKNSVQTINQFGMVK